MTQFRNSFSVMLVAGLLASCATTSAPTTVAQNDTRSTNATVQKASVSDISLADIRALSKGIFDQIFLDNTILSRNYEAALEDPFRIAITSVQSDLRTDRILRSDFIRALEGELIKTGIVEIHSTDSADWEYSIDTQLRSTVTGERGVARTAIYEMVVTMASIENENVGVWSETVQFTGRY